MIRVTKIRKVSVRLAVGAAVFAAAGIPGRAAMPETVHPGFKIIDLRPDNNFTPQVTGLGFLSDGRLVVADWGGLHADVDKLQTKGRIYLMKGVTGPNPSPTYSTYAENLADPVGMLVKDDKIYVTGGEKLIELPDANNDGKADAAKIICQIPGTHARHEFLFGLIFKDGRFWMNPSSSKATDGTDAGIQKNPNRGTVMSVDPATGAYEVYAMGLREPNGIGVGPENEIFVPDVQGNWLPANKLIHIRKGRFYGFKHQPPETWDNQKESPPVVYLPQGDVAQAPGTPLYIPAGAIPGDRFVGQMLLGDAVNGGIRRIFIEKVNGEFQGAVFHFTGGFEAGPNRMMWGPDGNLYVGMCGQGAPSWAFLKDYGLQKVVFGETDAFEMVAVRSRAGGLEIEYTHEVNAAGQSAAAYNVRSWHYEPTSAYGGPAIGTKTLAVGAVQVSPDKKKVFLPVSGLQAGTVVNVRPSGVTSASGLPLFTAQTWYTLNNISDSQPFSPPVKLAGPASVRKDGLIMRAWGDRLELACPLSAVERVQVRDVRGHLVADIRGQGARSLEVPTAAWAGGVYLVSVRSGSAEMRGAVAIP